VGLDGVREEVELGREVGVREAAGDECHDLALALGELGQRRIGSGARGPAGDDVGDQPAGDLRREERVSVGDDAHRAH
jgi:hypothetical protein